MVPILSLPRRIRIPFTNVSWASVARLTECFSVCESMQSIFEPWGIWVKQYSSGNIRFWLQRPATDGPYKEKINRLFT